MLTHLTDATAATTPSGLEQDGVADLAAAVSGLGGILDAALQVELLGTLLVHQVPAPSAVLWGLQAQPRPGHCGDAHCLSNDGGPYLVPQCRHGRGWGPQEDRARQLPPESPWQVWVL